MISSKYLNSIAIGLISLVLVLVILGMFFYNRSGDESIYAPRMYSDTHSLTYEEIDFYTDESYFGVSKINLKGDTASSGSKNVSVEGGNIVIMGGGTYVISGTLNNGSITVDSADSSPVRLILNGADITSKDFAAIYVNQAKKTVISTVKGTENSLSDGSEYSADKTNGENINAAVCSRDDLTINGDGILNITGNYADGIKCNDTLKITEGTIKITARDDGINTNDAIGLLSASLEVEAGGDGIKCENSENTSKGFIASEKTTLSINASGDGMYSSSNMYLTDTKCNVTSGGGYTAVRRSGGNSGRGWSTVNTSTDTPSTKCIKSDMDLNITGGTYTLSSADDGIHANGSITIDGSEITAEVGGDGIHADVNVVLSPAKIEIINSYEGIEGAFITINDGDIHIIASDDGINAVGENSSGGFGGLVGMHSETVNAEDVYFTVNGGTLTVESGGDGLDANGAIMINGGGIKVYGPENGGNSSLDFEYGFVIKGGSLLAAGSSGMAESPHETSTQNSLVFTLDQSFGKGSEIVIKDSDGKEVLSGTSAKNFNWVCASSKDIKYGNTYTLCVNDEEIASMEVTATVNSYGSKGREMGR